MVETDKKRFAAILRASMLTLGAAAPEVEVLRVWWSALNHFRLADVEAAFGEYVSRGKFAPRPADIIEIIDRMRPDGRPTADEAWSMIPRDEAVTVVWTDEMSEAFGVAKPLLDVRDQVAARMAFRDAYERAVDRNRREGKAPHWFASLGQDKQGRAHVLADAVTKNRITFERAVALLPHAHDEIAQAVGSGHLPMIEDASSVSKIRSMVGDAINKKHTAKAEEKENVGT